MRENFVDTGGCIVKKQDKYVFKKETIRGPVPVKSLQEAHNASSFVREVCKNFYFHCEKRQCLLFCKMLRRLNADGALILCLLAETMWGVSLFNAALHRKYVTKKL